MPKFQILPATQSFAELSPHTLVLELLAFTRRDIDDAIAGIRDSEPARILAHEMTHWFDAVGTVWGQSYLDGLFRAYDVILSHPSPDIHAYPAALRLFDTDRSILFPSYYKFVNLKAKPQEGPGDWAMSLTTGVRIRPDGAADESDPILFVRFQGKAGEIARQPITVGSLLELRALYVEAVTFNELAPLRPDIDAQFETLMYERGSARIFYDPLLTTYSAGAHLLSSAMNRTADTALVLAVGHRLSDLAPPPANLTFGPRRRNSAFKSNADRGYLFASLSYNFQNVTSAGATDDATLSALLKVSGLPDYKALCDAADLYVTRRRPSELNDTQLRGIRNKLQEAGLTILRWRRENGGVIRAADWSNLPSPQIMDREATSFVVGQEILTQADVEYLHDCSVKTDFLTRQALRAGRGLEFKFSDYVY